MKWTASSIYIPLVRSKETTSKPTLIRAHLGGFSMDSRKRMIISLISSEAIIASLIGLIIISPMVVDGDALR